jgi:hypothetical protein
MLGISPFNLDRPKIEPTSSPLSLLFCLSQDLVRTLREKKEKKRREALIGMSKWDQRQHSSVQEINSKTKAEAEFPSDNA